MTVSIQIMAQLHDMHEILIQFHQLLIRPKSQFGCQKLIILCSTTTTLAITMQFPVLFSQVKWFSSFLNYTL